MFDHIITDIKSIGFNLTSVLIVFVDTVFMHNSKIEIGTKISQSIMYCFMLLICSKQVE